MSKNIKKGKNKLHTYVKGDCPCQVKHIGVGGRVGHLAPSENTEVASVARADVKVGREQRYAARRQRTS